MADVTKALFDSAYYLEQNPDVARAGVDPYTHYMTTGWKEGRNPSAYFDTSYYLTKNQDVAAAGVNPLQHYALDGWREGRNPSAYFDTSYYLSKNPDVAAAGINPLLHYITNGWKEGRDPSASFDTSYYLQNNPDIAACGMNPLMHYIIAGKTEGREPKPAFNIEVDYSRYDTTGFFTNHPERQAVVEEACHVWESIITNEFPDVPAGTTIQVVNPNTGVVEPLTLTTPIDDLRLYLGSYNTADATLGTAHPFATSDTGNAALDARYNSFDTIEPWVGSINVNEHAANQLYFDPTPDDFYDDTVPANKYDFLDIMVHEIGHILGMGPQNAGSNYVKNINGVEYFDGPHVHSVYGGPVPLDFNSGAHIASNATMASTMKPSLNSGVRTLPTALDKAFFEDIGYTMT